MQRRYSSALFSLGLSALLVGCGSGGGNAGARSSPTSASTDSTDASPMAAIPEAGPLPIAITFDQVAIASGAGTLRLDMELKNTSKDPVQCDPSEFSAQLGSASPIDADTSAAVSCDPDSVDPGTTGKATMFFDIPGDYTGPVTVTLTVDDKLVGSGTTQIH
jgi:uncharacterized protein DUF4352